MQCRAGGIVRRREVAARDCYSTCAIRGAIWLVLKISDESSQEAKQQFGIKVLETSGFVSRQVDSDDARAIKLTLTPLGRQAIDGMIQLRRDRLAEALIKWDPSDTELLLSLLARLIGDLEN